MLQPQCNSCGKCSSITKMPISVRSGNANASLILDYDQRTRERRARQRHSLHKTLFAAALLYLGALFALWLLLRVGGDRWWLATLLLFSPRWFCALPLALLIPAAAVFARRALWVLAAAVLVVVFPIMDFRVPWARLSAPEGLPLRVLTYNVAGDMVTPDALAALIEQVRPDIIALQDCPRHGYADVLKAWHVHQSGELLIAAKAPVEVRQSIESQHPPHEWPRASLLECVVTAPQGEIPVATVHLPSPRYGLAASLDRRTVFAPQRRATLDEELHNRNEVSQNCKASLIDQGPGTIVLGDFNMPTDSSIYRRDWASYQNAFSQVGWGVGHTIFSQMRGFALSARVDQILMGDDWRPKRCWVGPDAGSDHRPLVADLIWRKARQ